MPARTATMLRRWKDGHSNRYNVLRNTPRQSGSWAFLLLWGQRISLILTACAFLSPSTVLADSDDLRKAGDFLQFAIPLTGLGATFYYKDKEGRWQLAKSAAANLLTVQGMKAGVAKLRPDYGQRTSYPSGHTNGAFLGAAFLNTRYGPYWGVPAYALAAVTGYSRVDADAHFWDDVVAGASIAVLYNWAFVTPMHKNVALVPMRFADSYGLGISVTDAGPNPRPVTPGPAGPTRFRFEYAFTAAYLRENVVRAPSNTGTQFDLYNFDRIDDPTPATIAEFEWKFQDRHSLAIQLLLFESRDTGTLQQPTSFGGVTFPANSSNQSAYRSYSIPLVYRYDLAPKSQWIARIGATLTPTFTSVELTDPNNDVKVEDWDVALAPNIMLGYRLSHDWRITADASGLSTGGSKVVDAGVRLTYALNRNWEFGIGYRRYESRQDTSELYNDVKYDAWQIAVAHLW